MNASPVYVYLKRVKRVGHDIFTVYKVQCFSLEDKSEGFYFSHSRQFGITWGMKWIMFVSLFACEITC